MIKIIDRYFLKELFFPFIVAVLGLVIIGLADVIFSLMEYVVNRGIDPHIVIKILLYKIPAIAVLFLPIASLFSVMLVMFRMISNNEINIYWTSGIVYERVLLPFVIFAIFVVFISFLLSEYIVPPSNYHSNTMIHQLILKESIPQLEENVFFKDIDDKYVYVKKINKKNNIMDDIIIYDLANKQSPRVITAKNAVWSESHWNLQNGKMYNYKKDGFLSFESGFENMNIKLSYKVDENYKKLRNPREMSSKEIKERATYLKKIGLDNKNMLVEYYLKFSGNLANMVFTLLGVIFVLFFVRSTKDIWGIILSIGCALLSISLFFFLTAYSRAMGIGGYLTPIVSAWVPIVVYFFILIVLWIFRRNLH
jgi:lipopolysaccharide export system permease protein